MHTTDRKQTEQGNSQPAQTASNNKTDENLACPTSRRFTDTAPSRRKYKIYSPEIRLGFSKLTSKTRPHEVRVTRRDAGELGLGKGHIKDHGALTQKMNFRYANYPRVTRLPVMRGRLKS
ncbi:hypothetical protein RRG08_019509 [Elysia crispata]|uniref:Uncharacterized protein n=1 Tax=Elysia crispata TaxID=231223 RepID=A0AAE1D2Y1_9GAST|nr:hypothetical protein RRG08_019509 [Elysia crispata]